MTKEEYEKVQLCMKAFQAEKRKNNLLRQKLAGVDPESLRQAQEDREAFALVELKRAANEIRTRERAQTVVTLARKIQEDGADREAMREEGTDVVVVLTWIANAVLVAGILLMPLVWVLG